MAGAEWSTEAAVSSQLGDEPYLADFFAAVRRLAAAHAHESRGPVPPIGRSTHPSEDPIRFHQRPSLRFAPAAISEFRPGHGGRPHRMFIEFMGLFGPHGPLPLHLTDYARRRQKHHHDRALIAFLNLFHHRMISLYYRAWAINRQEVSFEETGEDRFARYVASLIGLGTSGLLGRNSVPDLAKLHQCGNLAVGRGTASGLQALLQDYFGLPVTIQQFVGQWLELPPDSRCVLGRSPATGQLGRSILVGSRIWDVQHKFRIRVGPMGLADYLRMLPGGASLQRLHDWVLQTCGLLYDYDLQLVLRAAEVPRLRLGQANQLGRSTWLITRSLPRDADNLTLTPSRLVPTAAP